MLESSLALVMTKAGGTPWLFPCYSCCLQLFPVPNPHGLLCPFLYLPLIPPVWALIHNHLLSPSHLPLSILCFFHPLIPFSPTSIFLILIHHLSAAYVSHVLSWIYERVCKALARFSHHYLCQPLLVFPGVCSFWRCCSWDLILPYFLGSCWSDLWCLWRATIHVDCYNSCSFE